jgi:hypothetical protein
MSAISRPLIRDVVDVESQARSGHAETAAAPCAARASRVIFRRGTPFCITIDGNTKEDQTVPVRHYDTGEQCRGEVEAVVPHRREKIGLD